MMVRRGEIVLVNFPFASGTGAKLRPALVVQCDVNNRRLANTIVAMITSRTDRAQTESTQLLIELTTPEGRVSGLLHDSAVKCENLFTIEQAAIRRIIGRLSAESMVRVSDCLRASLDL